jgi:hypothetical protein
MVKQNKMVCLDVDLLDRCKGMNLSALLNGLLSDYLKEHDFDDLSLEQIDELIRFEKQKTELLKEIKLIDEGINGIRKG